MTVTFDRVAEKAALVDIPGVESLTPDFGKLVHNVYLMRGTWDGATEADTFVVAMSNVREAGIKQNIREGRQMMVFVERLFTTYDRNDARWFAFTRDGSEL